MKTISLDQKKEYIGIDYAKFIAALLVIAIHIPPFEDVSDTASDLFQQVVCRIAVPFFFLCTGYFLGDRIRDGRKTREYVWKIAKLYGFWSLCYLPLIIRRFWDEDKSMVFDVKELVKRFFLIGSYIQLWYLLATMIAVALLYLCVTRMKMQEKVLVGLVVLLYILGVLGNSYRNIWNQIPAVKIFIAEYLDEFATTRNGFFFGFPFITGGYLLYRHRENIYDRGYWKWTMLAGIGMMLEVIGLEKILKNTSSDMYFFTVITSICLFLSCAFMKMPAHCRLTGRKLRRLSTLLFLLHMLLNHYLCEGVESMGITMISPVQYVLVTLLSIAAALLICWWKDSKKESRAHLAVRLAMLLGIVLLSAGSVQDKVEASSQQTYYVSVKGSDKNPGTKAKPFRTIQKGVDQLGKGDTLLIGKGTYKEEITISAETSGSSGKEITIKNVPGEKVVISGSGRKSPTLLTLDGASYLKISGLEFTSAKGQDACAILVNAGSSHFCITSNKIHNITVPNPKAQDHCANAILLFGDSAKKAIQYGTIANNRIYDCETGWAECISVTANVTNVKVLNNTINDTGNIGIDFSGNYGYCSKASVDFPRNCVISGNKVSNCVSKSATSYGIYVDGGQNITIQNNVVKNCSGGIEIGAEQKPKREAYSTKNIKVINNTIQNNTDNGITVGGYTRKLGWVCNVTISGNTCKNNGLKNAILTLAKCKNVTVKNNSFVNTKGSATIVYSEFGSKDTKRISFIKNRYYNGHGKNRTSFVYLGREYTSFQKWVKISGDQNSRYTK